MLSRQWRLRLEDILEAIGRIERYIEGMGFEAFQEDEKTTDAVVRNLGIVGEAARHVPEEIQDRHPDVPWVKMRGARNVVIHEYSAISLDVVWQTITEDLPPLVPQLQAILEQEPEDAAGE